MRRPPREGALVLENRKQKHSSREKRVYVSTDLLAQLQILARDARIGYRSCFFRSAKSGEHRARLVHCDRLLAAPGPCRSRAPMACCGRPTPGTSGNGAAVNQVQQGIPLSEVQQQLGHARIYSTTIYIKLANPERRRLADRVIW